jgi:UDP-galactopyranose mutase
LPQLLYFAPVAWHDLWQRPQRLALALAEHYSLTYCNPVGMRSVRWSDWRRLVPRGRVPRGDSRVNIFRPRYLPWQGAPIDAVNRRWLAAQARRAFPALSQGDVALWVGAPSLLALALLESFRPAFVVYDCMDHFAGFQIGAARQRIEAAESVILKRADLVFVTSRPLHNELAERHAHVILAPNGVDASHFASAQRDQSQGETVIGYHGTLGEWLDYELIESLAASRPNWCWDFVGPIRASGVRRLIALPNVRHTPAMAYEDLPERIAQFDVGIIPFVRNRLTDAAQPVKLAEYLAAGAPVVATRLSSLRSIAGHVALPETKAEWLVALDAAVAREAHRAEAIAERRALAESYSWRATEEIVLAALGELRETSDQHAHHATRHRYRPAA